MAHDRAEQEQKMDKMTIRDAARICGGVISGQLSTELISGSIVIDSRQVQNGDLFAAFRGDHADGHDYIAGAFDRGAVCCLAERVPDGERRCIIVVESVPEAVEKLAAAYRGSFDIPIIGITGSVGKTTAKEMISAVLERHFQVLKTEGNLNNRIGVPMMLSRLRKEHEAAVIEMGISEFGEMSCLAQMVHPTIAVYTVIGHAHLEFLHDLEGVLRAKTEMLEYMQDTAPVVVNGDDPYLKALQCRQRKICCGFDESCDVRPENIRIVGEKTECDIVCGMRRIPVIIPAFGRHHISAALSAAAVGMLLGLSDEEIRDGIAAFRNVGRRSELVHTGFVTLFDDTYNANPDSVRSGIDTLIQMQGSRHICILGDMLELGEKSPQMHYEVGQYAKEQGVDVVITSGRLAKEASKAMGTKGIDFETRDALINELPSLLREGDCVLVKASKGSHFETVSAAIRELNV